MWTQPFAPDIPAVYQGRGFVEDSHDVSRHHCDERGGLSETALFGRIMDPGPIADVGGDFIRRCGLVH